MRKVTLNPSLLLVISLIIFVSWFSQVADRQTAEVKTLVSNDIFTGKVVGVSDGDIKTRIAIKWQCASGHVWKAIPHHVKNGSWCPLCGIESIKSKRGGSLDDILPIICSRGDSCLEAEKCVNF